jgi:hypothetical protein
MEYEEDNRTPAFEASNLDPPKSPLKRGTLKSEAPFLRGLGDLLLPQKSRQIFLCKPCRVGLANNNINGFDRKAP